VSSIHQLTLEQFERIHFYFYKRMILFLLQEHIPLTFVELSLSTAAVTIFVNRNFDLTTCFRILRYCSESTVSLGLQFAITIYFISLNVAAVWSPKRVFATPWIFVLTTKLISKRFYLRRSGYHSIPKCCLKSLTFVSFTDFSTGNRMAVRS
jgi:hypothetical protein